ncbi:MAG: hypothetical protein KAR42_14835 [candidate division Zixibacteria bacterium]|nr:hypothetical protein [candidate division Zixibacteria bacterium]
MQNSKRLPFWQLIVIVLFMTIVFSKIVQASNVNDTETKTSFMEHQSLSQIALAMTAYQQYTDASVAGTTVVYKRFKGGISPVFLLRNIIIVTGSYTQEYNEKASDTWVNRFDAAYTPLNE